jgi:tetratricopeptide (TPR) repeat protein
MTPARPLRLIVLACTVMVAVAPARPATAQEGLAQAGALYASARYADALELLDRLRVAEGPDRADALSVEKYRALCLLALGREADADAAFASIVGMDPTYQLDPREIAPSVRAFYRAVRQRALPGVVQGRYAEARAAYERKDFSRAAEGFRLVVELLDDQDMEGRLADLRVLADDFRELSVAASGKAEPPSEAPTPAPAAPAPPEEPPPVTPEAPRTYGPEDPGVAPPVVIRQILPSVPGGIASIGRTRGLYEVIIDETGRVTSVLVRTSLHAAYDRAFIESAATWQYRPATVDGRPVRYRKPIQVSYAR